jgi:hypothetical protein
MVEFTDDSGRTATEDRGQLVLVGAVAIAFVLIGLVVLFNGVVFTENVGSEGAVVDAKSSGATTVSIERGVGQAAHTVHTNQKYDTSDDSELETHLEDNVTEFNTWHRIHDGETRGVFTNVSFEGVNQTGTRIVQDDDSGAFTSADGNTRWELTGGDRIRIDEFVMRVQPPVASNDMRVSVLNDNGVNRTIRLNGDASGTITLENVTGAPIDGGSQCSSIGAGADDAIILRLSDGIVTQQQNCTFSLIHPRQNQSIKFGGETNAFFGTYDLVLKTEITGNPGNDFGGPDSGYKGAETTNSDPVLSQIAWSADYEITVDGATIQQNTTKEVEHYG